LWKAFFLSQWRVIKTFKKKKKEYAQQELQIYEQQVKAIEEKSKWG
jgi:hypothetical protein